MYIYIYIVVLLLATSPASNKRVKSIDRKMTITPWGDLTHFVCNLIFKKKQSCFKFSFAYQKIRESMKTKRSGEVQGGSRGIQEESRRGLESPCGSQGVLEQCFCRFVTASGTPGGSQGSSWGSIFMYFQFLGTFHATCMHKSIFH